MPRGRRSSFSTRVSASGISAADQSIINIAAGNINQTIQHIQQRALTLVEEAQQAQAVETELLAQGVARLTERFRDFSEQDPGTKWVEPYRGLLEYRLADAQVFHGRQEAIFELWKRLQRSPLTILHSESGAGKTSLLQAGIAPRLLMTGNLPLLVRPYEQSPSIAIKRAFLPNLERAPGLQSAPLREFLIQIKIVLGEERALYILLDQFEEFFTRLEVEQQKDFVQQLTDCLEDETLLVGWVLALRSEYFSDLALFQPLIKNPFENEYRLNRLSRSEAVEVITLPAKSAGITYQEGLVEIILDHLGGQEIAPPQVQLVCSALVQDLRPGQSEITRAIYEREGGAERILRTHLGRVLQRQLAPKMRKAARSLLEALVDSKQQRLVRSQNDLVEELNGQGIQPEGALSLLETLTTHRLLRSSNDETGLAYELAHDYLLSEIHLDPEVQARKAAQELLSQEVRVFQQTGSLIAAERLAFIQPFLEQINLTSEMRQLIQESQSEVERETAEAEGQRQRELAQAQNLTRIQRQRTLIFAAGTLVSLVLLGIVILFYSQAQSTLGDLQIESTRSAQNASLAQAQATIAAHAETIARAQLLAAQGQVQFETDPLRGLRLVVEGLAVVPSHDQEVRETIRQDLVELAATGRVADFGEHIENIYFNPESDRFVLDRLNGPGELRRLSDNSLVAKLGENINSVSFIQNQGQGYIVVIYCQEPCGVEQGFSAKGDLFYFNPTGEVRRSQDGQILPLTGSVKKVENYPDYPNYLFISYDDDQLLEVRDGFESQPLDLGEGLVKVEPIPYPDGTFLVFTFQDKKKLVRLTGDGQLLAIAEGDERGSFEISPSLGFPYLFIDNPGLDDDEIRRLDDPDARVDVRQGVTQVFFSPYPDHPFMVLDYYEAPSLLYFPDGRSISLGEEIVGVGPNDIAEVIFSPNPEAEFFIITYNRSPANPSGEIRSLENGEIIGYLEDDLEDKSGSIIFSEINSAPYFVVDYSPYYGLHDSRKGYFVDYLVHDFKGIFFSDNPEASEFIVNRSEDYADRYDMEGNAIGNVSGYVEDVYFSPPGNSFYIIVDYSQQAGEILDVEELPGEIDSVVFGSKYLVINYRDFASSQLRLAQDASLVMEFPKSVSAILPSPRRDVTYFLLSDDFVDTGTELWDDRSGFLADLGLGLVDYHIDWDSEYMLVRYRNERAYILDLHWLSSLGGKTAILSAEALIQGLCSGPLTSSLFDPAEFVKFLETDPAIRCP